MSLYKLLNTLSIKGDRVVKGSVIEIDDAYASSLDQIHDIQLVDMSPSDKTEEKTEGNTLESLSAVELKDKAKSLGLSDKGNKKDLVERITLFLSSDKTEEKTEDSDVSADSDEE